MKQKTRDNIIYLGVGLSIAALVVADFFYTDSRGLKMWLPSKFAFRAWYSTGFLAYLVVKQGRKSQVPLVQIVESALVASLVHLGIVFLFRQEINVFSGLLFSAFAVLEMLVLVMLTLELIPRLHSKPGDRQNIY